MLKILLLLFSLILGLILIAFGVYIIYKKKILIYPAPLWVGITLTSIGGIMILFLMSIVLYDILKPSKIKLPLISLEYEAASPVFFPKIMDSIDELKLFIYMISSSWYDKGQYRGQNYRSPQNQYFKRLNEEFVKNPEPESIRKTRADDSSFNDDRLIYVWKLYKDYMDNRFDISKLILKIKQYNYFIRMNKDVIISNIDSFLLLQNVVTVYISVFKLLHRKFIQQKYGLEILKYLRETLYLLSKYVVDKKNRSAFLDMLYVKLNNELSRNPSYYPILILRGENITYNQNNINFNSLIPDIEKLKRL